MIVHTPTLLCFPPTSTPVEIGHPWPTYSATLTPAHALLLLLLTYQTSTYTLNSHTRLLFYQNIHSATFHALQTNKHMFVLYHWHHCFCIFICLLVSDNPPLVAFPLLFIQWSCFSWLFLLLQSFSSSETGKTVPLVASESFNLTRYPPRRAVLAAPLHRESHYGPAHSEGDPARH